MNMKNKTKNFNFQCIEAVEAKCIKTSPWLTSHALSCMDVTESSKKSHCEVFGGGGGHSEAESKSWHTFLAYGEEKLSHLHWKDILPISFFALTIFLIGRWTKREVLQRNAEPVNLKKSSFKYDVERCKVNFSAFVTLDVKEIQWQEDPRDPNGLVVFFPEDFSKNQTIIAKLKEKFYKTEECIDVVKGADPMYKYAIKFYACVVDLLEESHQNINRLDLEHMLNAYLQLNKQGHFKAFQNASWTVTPGIDDVFKTLDGFNGGKKVTFTLDKLQPIELNKHEEDGSFEI